MPWARAGMASAGFKVRGAYHFGHPNSDAAAQAHHFVSAVGATQTHTDVALSPLAQNVADLSRPGDLPLFEYSRKELPVSLMVSRRRAGTLRAGDFVVLDIEASDKTSPAAVASWCKSWLSLVQQLMGLPKQRVWVYTGAWFWNPQAGGSAAVGDHPLWVSGYVSGHPPMPKVPALSFAYLFPAACCCSL